MQIAIKAGTAPEHLVKNAALRLLEDESSVRIPASELPVWNLGTIGSLHRRETPGSEFNHRLYLLPV